MIGTAENLRCVFRRIVYRILLPITVSLTVAGHMENQQMFVFGIRAMYIKKQHSDLVQHIIDW